MLGVPLGDDTFVAGFVEKRLIGKLFDTIDKLVNFEDSQAASYLLRVSYSIVRAVHFMRTTPFHQWQKQGEKFDGMVRGAAEKILGCSMSERVFIQAALTPKLGGLGLRRCVEHAGFAYSASWHESKQQSGENWTRPTLVSESHVAQDEASLTFDKEMHKYLVDSAPDDREKQRLLRIAQPHAGSFITAVPSNEDGNDAIMRPRVFRTAVLYRLGLPVLNNPKPCPLCMQPINIYGDHATCCTKKGDVIIRHNAVRDLVYAIAVDGVLNPQREKKGILGPTSGRRPGDVSIPDWSGDPLAIDVAVTSPITKTSELLNHPCEEYGIVQKHHKYDAGFKGTNWSFCAMIFETFGAVNQEGEEVLRQLFRYAAKHLGREFSSYCVRAWGRVSCAVQKSVAQAILNRVDGTEPEEEPEDVAVPESVEPVRKPLVSLTGIIKKKQVGSEERKKESQKGESELEEKKKPIKEKKEIKEEGESEKKNMFVVAADVAGRASGSSVSSSRIPLIINSIAGGWGRGGNKKDAAKHKRISPPSRVSSRSVLASPSVSTCCVRYSSSSSPHNTVSKIVSPHTITPTQTLEVLRHDRHPNPLK